MEPEISNNENLFTLKRKLPCSCIIPAAGLSSRMGQWKALLKMHDGRSMLERALDTALICSQVILVGGHRFQDLEEVMSSRKNVLLLENDSYRKGMLGSIQTGVQYAEGDFFILPMDMPFIDAVHLNRIYSASRDVPQKIIRPVYKGIPGHPVLFPASWKSHLQKMKGDKLFKELEDSDQYFMDWKDDSVVFDVDDAGDYERYQSLKA